MGHSQGGASAYVVAMKDDRIKTSIPLHPDCNFWVRKECSAISSVKKPVLAIAGKKDRLVSANSVKANILDKSEGDSVVYAENKNTDHASWMGKADKVYGTVVLNWLSYHLKKNDNSDWKQGQFLENKHR